MERHCLCSILAELRPVEIIKPAKVLSSETERVLLQNTRSPLVNDLVPSLEFWDAEKTVYEIRNVYGLDKDSQAPGFSNDESISIPADSDSAGNSSGCLPDVISDLLKSGEDGNIALSALGGCLFYLRQAFLDEALLRFATFEMLPCSGFLNAMQKTYMTLDAAALENLEILENNRNGGSSGYMQHAFVGLFCFNF